MRVPNISLANDLVDRLDVLRGRQNQLNQQLATGQRISLASEDPQAASRVMMLRSEMSTTQQYARNMDAATSIAETVGTGLTRLNDISDRAGELITLAASPTASASDKSSYAVEMNQLLMQAMDAANSQFNGQYVFNGINITSAPFSAVVNAPDSAEHPTSIAAASSVAVGANGLSIQVTDSLTISPYSTGSNNVAISTFINNLQSARDAMEGRAGAPSLSTAAANLKTSENAIVNAVAENASLRGRFESIRSAAEQRFTDITGLISRETDVDLAQTMVNLSKNQTAYQAAMQAGAQILRLSLLDYIR